MNVINAITAGISIVLMSIEIVFSSLFYESCYYNGYNHGYGRNDGYFGKYNFKEICLNLQVLNVQCSLQKNNVVCFFVLFFSNFVHPKIAIMSYS